MRRVGDHGNAQHSRGVAWTLFQYRHSPDRGCGFNAFFSESSGLVEGTIVDDFSPGKAAALWLLFFSVASIYEGLM